MSKNYYCAITTGAESTSPHNKPEISNYNPVPETVLVQLYHYTVCVLILSSLVRIEVVPVLIVSFTILCVKNVLSKILDTIKSLLVHRSQRTG